MFFALTTGTNKTIPYADLESLRVTQVEAYFCLAFNVLYIYHFITTISAEARTILGHSLSLVQILYFTNRYGSLLGSALQIMTCLWLGSSNEFCLRICLAWDILSIFSNLSVNALFAVRAWVLCSRNGFVLGSIILLELGVTAARSYSIFSQYAHNPPISLQLGPLACGVENIDHLPPLVAAGLSLFLDTLIFVLIVARTWPSVMYGRITKLLLLDGLIYFIIVIIVNIVYDCTTVLVHTPFKLPFASQPLGLSQILVNLTATELVIRLRDSFLETHTSPVSTLAVADIGKSSESLYKWAKSPLTASEAGLPISSVGIYPGSKECWENKGDDGNVRVGSMNFKSRRNSESGTSFSILGVSQSSREPEMRHHVDAGTRGSRGMDMYENRIRMIEQGVEGSGGRRGRRRTYESCHMNPSVGWSTDYRLKTLAISRESGVWDSEEEKNESGHTECSNHIQAQPLHDNRMVTDRSHERGAREGSGDETDYYGDWGWIRTC